MAEQIRIGGDSVHQLKRKLFLERSVNLLFNKTELKKTEEDYAKLEVPNEDQVSTYFKIRQQLDNLGKELLSYIQKPQYLLPFLQPGRLIKVSCPIYCRIFYYDTEIWQ